VISQNDHENCRIQLPVVAIFHKLKQNRTKSIYLATLQACEKLVRRGGYNSDDAHASFLAPVVWYQKLWHTSPANDTGKNKTSMASDCEEDDVVEAVVALRLLKTIRRRSNVNEDLGGTELNMFYPATGASKNLVPEKYDTLDSFNVNVNQIST